MLTLSVPMEETLGSVIKRARQARGITQRQVAEHFGITRPAVTQWETGGGPQRDKLKSLTDFLGIEMEAAMRGELVLIDKPPIETLSPIEPTETPNARRGDSAMAVSLSSLKGPRNVPVRGTGSGGSGGDFRFNGRTIDNAPRPPGIQDRMDVFVIYIVGNSVSPKYEDGDPIYIDPNRRPAPRDYVLIELKGESEHEPGDAYVKRLVSRSGKILTAYQHNPPGELTFKEEDIAHVYRVIPYPELIGI